MCIAVASPAGVKSPTLDTLKNCWDNNRDGAGFAFPLFGQVKIQKGYMTWDAFKDAWLAASQKYDFDKLSVLVHFRITSHGRTCPELTHPFPLQSDEGALKKLEYLSDYGIIHNGMIDLVNVPRNGNVSDTLVFVRDYLTLIAKNENWLRIPENMKLIYKMIGSKMAIIDGEGYIGMTDGFEEFEGNYYSNSGYKENRYRFNSAHSPCYYDYDSDYDGYYGCNAGYTHYNFESEVASRNSTNDDDVFDFTHFDSDLNDSQRSLMSFHTGWTISSHGTDITIDSQEDTEKYFIDRKRNIWEAIREQVREPDDSIADVVMRYNLIGEDGHVFDENGKEIAWCAGEKVDEKMFVA